MRKIKEYYPFIEKTGIVIVIFLFTFPHIEPDYTIGLDSSYVWALNFLFNNDYNALKDLVYPIGILGFLKMPTTEGYKLIYSLGFYSILKIWFIYSFLYLANKTNPQRKYLSVFIIAIISFFCNIDLLIIGLCLIQNLHFIEKSRVLNLSLSVVIAFLGLCIKSSIGISAFSIIFMSFLIEWYLKRNYFNAIKFVSISLLISIFSGLLVFNNFELLYRFCLNAFKLSINYSDALSIYPENNWYLLSGFLTTIFIIPFICKDRNLRIAFFLFLPTVFAIWKHAMSREDISHMSILFNFLFLFWGILIVYSKIKIKTLFFTSSICILLLYSNMSKLPMFKGCEVEVCGINNFVESVINYKDFRQKYITISYNNIQSNKLNESIVKAIGSASIDIYPWELSYIPANNFNWKHRTTLQGGSYARWLDNISAQDFERKNGADFILLHFVKDKWGGDFGSIDERYLLNDNPKTIFNLLNNYLLRIKTDQYLLFYKNKKNTFSKIINEKKKSTTWNTWISIPDNTGEILRLKVFSGTSLIGKIKNFLYKSEAYFIDYLMEDDKILSYRYIPENGKDGIWLNPLIQFPASNQLEQKAIKIRFRCSYSIFNKDSICYQFERNQLDTIQYPINKTVNSANYLFFKTKPNRDSLLLKTINRFDDLTNKNILSDKGVSYSGNYSNKIDGEGYSYVFEYSLDSLWKNIDNKINYLSIETDLKYLNVKSSASIIISISGSKDNFWHAAKLENNKENCVWEYSYLNKILSRENHNIGKLKIYVWNSGQDMVFIDDFRVSIKSIENKK